MVSNTTATGVPFVLEIKTHLKTDYYENIAVVATGRLGNSRKGFGVFTDTG